MPVATTMNGIHEGRSSPLSPISPRTAKAGLFRARSPPVEMPSTQQMMFDLNLNNRIDPFAGANTGRYTPESSESGHGLMPPRGNRSVEGDYASSSGANAGHTPPMTFLAQGRHPPSPPHSDPHFGLVSGSGEGAVGSDEDETASIETSTMGMGGGSDEMLMTLLAGQAVVDCERMQVAGWEEVESWKKVSLEHPPKRSELTRQELSLLSTRLESLVARHQREAKILTAARTLQKLNTANKR